MASSDPESSVPVTDELARAAEAEAAAAEARARRPGPPRNSGSGSPRPKRPRRQPSRRGREHRERSRGRTGRRIRPSRAHHRADADPGAERGGGGPPNPADGRIAGRDGIHGLAAPEDHAAPARRGGVHRRRPPDVINLMSIDFNTAQDSVQRVLDGSTGRFRSNFADTADDFVKALKDEKIITRRPSTTRRWNP